MSLETELLSLLEADAAVTGYVDDRLRHEWLDQNARYPAIVISRISTSSDRGLDLTKLTRIRAQVDCFARTFAEARALADAVIAALDNYQGAAGAFAIDSILLANDQSLGERVGSEETRRISLDFFVTY